MNPLRQVVLSPLYGSARLPNEDLFTDEANFTREDVHKSRNSHVWTDENPHAAPPWVSGMLQSEHLGRISGWMCDWVIPFSTKSHGYRVLANPWRRTAWALLSCVCVCQNMSFQHDGAPPNFSFAVRDHRNQRFGQQWIGPIVWPLRSPDFTPLWGYMKYLIYEIPVASEEDPLARVMAATDVGGRRIGDSVYQNMVRKYRICVEVCDSQ